MPGMPGPKTHSIAQFPAVCPAAHYIGLGRSTVYILIRTKQAGYSRVRGRRIAWRAVVQVLHGKACRCAAFLQLGLQLFHISLYGITHINILHKPAFFQPHHTAHMGRFSRDII